MASRSCNMPAPLFSLSECAPGWPTSPDYSANCLHDPADWRTTAAVVRKTSLRGTILIDMDNTLNDWDSQFRRLMSRYHPDIGVVPASSRRDYFMENNYPSEYRQSIIDLCNLRGFWSTMPVAKGAIAAVNEMCHLGLDVWIVSTPDNHFTGRCAQEKYDWVESHFGPEWKARLILCKDKTLVRGDILIDDKPNASQGRVKPEWKHILFCQPYNTEATAAATLHCWDDWYNTLARFLKDGD